MAEPAKQRSPSNPQNSETDFRWQALFQRAGEPFFILNRHRRILFVNRAWEELTGLSAAEARGLVCLRRPPEPQDPWDVVIRTVCCPPPEVLQGKPGRTRRLVPRADRTPRWWDLEFLPLQEPGGLLCVLGKITPLASDETASRPPLPEKLVSLRVRTAERYGLEQLASKLPALERVLEQVHLARQTQMPVLILGEPGTGKYWVARTIHHQGTMREGTFAALDCARIPTALLSPILLGASSPERQLGEGTRYLKEPSFLARELQIQLCAYIREAQESAKMRILAGCSALPQEEIRSGRLTEELYCGLSTLVISLPPLRERLVDLPDLVERLLERINTESERPIKGLTPEAWELLRGYSWPGNLRELYTLLRSACQRTTTNRIDAGHLPAKLRLAVRLDQTSPPVPERAIRLDEILEQAERRLILLALRKAGGNRSRAAELLSIWRARLLRRMEALGITEPD
jgi:transcriptional regulator with AAA-type ATPase domain